MSLLSLQEKHDVKSALLAIRWLAEAFERGGEAKPPDSLVLNQLRKSYELLDATLAPLIEEVDSDRP